MKKIILFALLVLHAGMVFSKENKNTIINYDKSGYVRSIEFSKNDITIDIPKTAEDFFTDILKKETGVNYVVNNTVRLSKGNETYEQYYKGLKVDGAYYTFHFDNTGVMFYAHGNYVKVSGVNIEPSISIDESKAIYAKYKQIDIKSIDIYNAELCIKEFYLDDSTDTSTSKLVYKTVVYSRKHSIADIVYIDALNGDVLSNEPYINSTCSIGTFETAYLGTKQAGTDYTNNYYRLYDDSRNAVIWTKDLMNNSAGDYYFSQELTDLDNHWYYSDFSDRADMALEVHWILQQIYDRLYNVHGKSSFDNNGKSINAYVRASINGTTDNAAWDNYNKLLFFGKGSNFPRPFSSVDVIGHEFGHGITNYQIGWGSDQLYLNEGLSDIWGAIMDYRFGYIDHEVWKMGENIFYSDTTDCLRNIAQPNSSFAYSQIAGTYMSNDYNNGGHYVKGGVFSHWFYLLVNGGFGQNEKGNWYLVNGVGMDVAEALIVKAVYDNYLRSQNTYPEIRTAFINAASAMNIEGLVGSVINAWYAVGVGSHEMSIYGNSEICGSETYYINNLPSGCTVSWDFINGSTYTSLISQNDPYANQCTITVPSNITLDKVLRATIYYGNQVITSIGKNVYGGRFIGYYSQQGNYYHYTNYPNIPETTFRSHDEIDVNQTCLVTLSSPFFIGKQITYSGTNVSLNQWNNDGNGTIQLKFNYTSNHDQILFVHGTGTNNCGNFAFSIKAFRNLIPNLSPQLSIFPSTNSIEIELNGLPNGYTDNVLLEIANIMTGERVYEGYFMNKKETISTKGWSPGTYAVKASYKGEIVVKKISIK